MTSRERFLRTMHFEDVDRPPLWTMGPWSETLRRWYKEGLPVEIDPHEFFGYDDVPLYEEQPIKSSRQGVVFDFGPIPRFHDEVVEETDVYIIRIDEYGAKKKEFKGELRSMPQWLEFPVKNRRDWGKMKERFNAEDSRRYPLYWSKELVQSLVKRDYTLGLGFCTLNAPSFFGWIRSLVGLENTLFLFYDDPQLIHQMNTFYESFIITVLEEAVSKVEFDFVNFFEDMAYNHGPLISPQAFREFMLSHYKRVTSFLRHHGVDIICVDCDGNMEELIPLWLEGGVNVVWPLEVAAGMDALALRKKYGESLGLWGNIDKRALAKGKEDIEREVMSKVPLLVKQGGFIPMVDHVVPPDVSLENYLYYLQLIKKIFRMDG